MRNLFIIAVTSLFVGPVFAEETQEIAVEQKSDYALALEACVDLYGTSSSRKAACTKGVRAVAREHLRANKSFVVDFVENVEEKCDEMIHGSDYEPACIDGVLLYASQIELKE